MKDCRDPMHGDKNISCRRAFENVAGCLNGSNFPSFVLRGIWQELLFCESEIIIWDVFPDVIKLLLKEEQSSVAALLNLTRSMPFKFENAPAIYMDAGLTKSNYFAALDQGDLGNEFFRPIDYYAIASDVGSWCIYVEEENDIAVIAFRSEVITDGYKEIVGMLKAKPIGCLTASDAPKRPPFNILVPDWKEGLNKNYRTRHETKW